MFDGKIYKITNLINGLVYIGQTTGSLLKRWRYHCYPNSKCIRISNAIQKYGKENFIIEQIDVADDMVHLNELEQYWIEVYDSLSPNGYNLNCGGNAASGISDETRKRLSESHKGHITSEATKQKLRESSLKYRHSKESIEKLRKNQPNKRSVMCVETGIVYETIHEAGRNTNNDYRNIHASLVGRQKTCGGCHWIYVS